MPLRGGDLPGAGRGQSPKVPDYADGLAAAHESRRCPPPDRSVGRGPRRLRSGDRRRRAAGLGAPEGPDVPGRPGGLVASSRLGAPRPGRSRRRLGRRPPGAGAVRGAGIAFGEQWYETACCHAELSGLAGVAGSGISADRSAPEANAAMDLLHKAAALGFRNADAIRTEAALDPLRDRPDFRLLMMDLAIPEEPFAP